VITDQLPNKKGAALAALFICNTLLYRFRVSILNLFTPYFLFTMLLPPNRMVAGNQNFSIFGAIEKKSKTK
jgi:hypothetical protein